MSTVELYTRASIIKLACGVIKHRGLGKIYARRLKFEIDEIDKQGAFEYWSGLLNENKHFDDNPSQLVLPWLLGMVDSDPLEGVDEFDLLYNAKFSKVKEYIQDHGRLPTGFIKDQDMPDIDLDCIPTARDPIKAHAAKKYGVDIDDGYGAVCSVGTWQTYKLKSALLDVAAATDLVSKSEVFELTTNLPDDVDELKDGGKSVCRSLIIEDDKERECGTLHKDAVCPSCGGDATDNPTIGKLLEEHGILNQFYKAHSEVFEYAVRLVGKIKTMGMHAGALIIADRPLYGNIPMAKSATHGYWVSLWTEGRNAQLSKFGYNKWDILGLKNLKYVFTCCRFIEENRGISFGKNMSGWDDINPDKNRAGHYFENGEKKYIELNDSEVLRLANEAKTDAIFQFDTELAKSILANGVRSFEDLMLFNAMGHPGPMASIPEAVKNRDDKKKSWVKFLDPEIYEILKDTHGVIVYQEQLQAMWQTIAGFTAPEAQEARKAVAKKWVHKLKPIQQKWMNGASKKLTPEAAAEWWEKMETFGRYAFNRSHAVAYCLVAHRCLWLKAHFAPEWWAAVMSDCHPDKLVRYMGVARSEGIVFDTLNVNNLTVNFSVDGDVINPGLIGVKKIGEKAAEAFGGLNNYQDIDEFVTDKGKNKIVLERLIKLGAFKKFIGHENSKAVWMWYQYKYCSGVSITKLRKEMREQLLIDEGKDEKWVEKEKQRQIEEYKNLYPKRNKIPNKILNFKPKPDDSRSKIMTLYSDDFLLSELLEFEKEFLGYYLHSPLDLYITISGRTIEDAKQNYLNRSDAILEAVIIDREYAQTRNNTTMCKLIVSDGIQNALLIVWEKALRLIVKSNLEIGTGISAIINYDEKRRSFSIARGETIIGLIRQDNAT